MNNVSPEWWKIIFATAHLSAFADNTQHQLFQLNENMTFNYYEENEQGKHIGM